MLTSAALVLMMSGPGLALFYGGLVRKKNILGTMMQTFAMMAVITVLWALVIYSLAFGTGGAFIGGLHNVFLHGVPVRPADHGLCADDSRADVHGLPVDVRDYYACVDYRGVCRTHEVFCDAGVHGAVEGASLFTSPMAHMVWGVGGGFLSASPAGSSPVWTSRVARWCTLTSGVSALVTAIYLGKRLGYPKKPMPPHSVVLSFVGACLLWVGWFGFNAGSALAAERPGDLGFCGDALRGSRCGNRVVGC